MTCALQRRGSLPNKIVLALQLHSEQHQNATTFEVRRLHFLPAHAASCTCHCSVEEWSQ